MVLMLDTEEAEIPENDNGFNLFDLTLYLSDNGKDHILTLNIPNYFETDKGTYEGYGVLKITLAKVLEEYLENFWQEDDGEGIEELVDLLRHYAKKFAAAKKKGNPCLKTENL